jgi:hypothetical protein
MCRQGSALIVAQSRVGEFNPLRPVWSARAMLKAQIREAALPVEPSVAPLTLYDRIDQLKDSGRVLLANYFDGKIGADEWADRFDGLLFDGHVDAIILGRNLAGDGEPKTALDEATAELLMNSERGFINNFKADLIEGRYADAPAGAEWRSDLYASKLRGSANDAWVTYGPQDQEITWVLTAQENCADCPILADFSPYTPLNLATTPGLGDTECLANCKCILRRSDGSEGFPPPTATE